MRIFLAFIALIFAVPASAAPATDWARVTSQTSDGAFIQGNPNAKVKLVEYLSLTCPHCAHFEAEGIAPLTTKYIRTGLVSYEVRHILFNSFDFAASLLARCNGPAFFFAVTPTVFAQQPKWLAQGAAWGKTAKLTGLKPEQALPKIAAGAGLTTLFAKRGLPAAKANACLTNRAGLEQLADIARNAQDVRGVSGTPSFDVNGQRLESNGSWASVEAGLKAALAAK